MTDSYSDYWKKREEQQRLLEEEAETGERRIAPAPTAPDVVPEAPPVQMEVEEEEEEEEQEQAEAKSPMEKAEEASPISAFGSAMGLGMIDTAVDAVDSIIPSGTKPMATRLNPDPDSVPSLKKLWDNVSRRDESKYQAVRKLSAEILPSLYIGGWIGKAVKGLSISNLSKGALIVAGENAVDLAVINVNEDVAQQDNAARVISDAIPWAFGPSGLLPFSDDWKTLDSDSPEIRKYKNEKETVFLNALGNTVGFLAERGVNPLNWFKPKDKISKQAKEAAALKSADPDTQFKILELEEALETNPSDYSKDVLITEIRRLRKQLDETGTTELDPRTPLERAWERAESTQLAQMDEDAFQLLEAGAAYYEPKLMPKLAKPGSNAVQSIPPMNVARNMADVAYLKNTGRIGDPAPVLTENFIRNANIVGKSRNAVAGLAEAVREFGNFDTIINGFRITRAGMSEASWKIYRDIMDPLKSTEDLKNLFLDDRATQVLLDGTKVDYLNEVQNLGAELAIRDLFDLYLNRQTTESSARIMDTFAREITSFAEGAETFAELADNNRVQEMVLDKLEFLMAEAGINKYISGWMLNNKGILTRLKGKSDDAYELANLIKSEFDTAITARGKKLKEFRETLETARRENPEFMQPLMDAFRHSDGDVTTIIALKKWVDKQLSWKGLFKSNDGKMNMFASELWSVRYNNVLSGLAAARALIGNTAGLTLKMLSSATSAAVYAPFSQGESLKKFAYLYGGIRDTISRAASDGIKRARLVHRDPEAWLEAIRKDYRPVTESEKWRILEGLEEAGGLSFGQQFELNMTRRHHLMSKNAVMRWGTTAMAGLDAMTDTFNGVLQSRVKAYYDVVESTGLDVVSKDQTKKILEASEKMHYEKMFDKNGVLTDEAAKFASGEIALNLDSVTSKKIDDVVNSYPVLKSFLMFPRTGINGIKYGLSGVPFIIPGKVRRTVMANLNDADTIKQVLAEHGIPYEGNQYALAQFKQLKEEYIGRWALSSLTFSGILYYAFSGDNVRGVGPQDFKELKYLKENFDWQPTSVRIPGTNRYQSVQGIPILEQIVNIVGNIAMYKDDMDESLIEDWGSKVAWTLSATWLNGSPLAGLDPLLDIVFRSDGKALKRLAAREIRSQIPLSGALGVTSQAIDNGLKNVHDDIRGYLFNRLPLLNSTLPKVIDPWTGQPENLAGNPLLRTLSALNPLPISANTEPWRLWLHQTQWQGMSTFYEHSEGYKYTKDQQEAINRYIGTLNLPQLIEQEFMNGPKAKIYKQNIEEVRELRQAGDLDSEEFALKTSKLALYRDLDRMANTVRSLAQAYMEREFDEIPYSLAVQEDINKNTTFNTYLVPELIRKGQITYQELRKASQKRQRQIERKSIQELRQLNNNN